MQKKLLGRIAIVIIILVFSSVVMAQVSNNFDVRWSILSGGGGVSQSQNYVVRHTLGQWTGGVSKGDRADVASGFWYTVATPTPTPLPVTATPLPTSQPTPTTEFIPTPTSASVVPVFIDPTVVVLKQGQTQTFQASGGTGTFNWGASGGDLDTTTGSTVVYTAGNQNGNFTVNLTSGEAEAVANVQIGGVNIVALADTQINSGDTLLFEITNPSENQAPFSWVSTNNSVGTILPVGGGQQGELTAANTGITEVYAKDDLGTESNHIQVIVGNSIEIPDVKGEAGKRAVVHINANTAFEEPVTSLQMDVGFDPTLLQAREGLVTYRSANFSLAVDTNNASGAARLLLTSLTGEEIKGGGTGPILDLVFDVSAGALTGATSPLALSNVELVSLNAGAIPVTTINGVFEVCPACLVHDGDINGDGKISVIDLQMAINIYLQRYTPTSEEFAAADIAPPPNGDDKVNVVDVLKILNRVLGRPGLRTLAAAPGDEPVTLTVPSQLTAQAGQSLIVQVEMENSVPIGGLDITLAYPQAADSISGTPTVTSPRGKDILLMDTNDNPGVLSIIMYSLDTVKEVAAGSGVILEIDFGVVSQAVNSKLEVVEAAVSDVNGTPINFEVLQPSSVYLPVVIK